jgi:MraZ protein
MFLSSYESGVDAKKRVSVPASFRRALRAERRREDRAQAPGEDLPDERSEDEIYLWPAMDKPCLEGGGAELIRKMHRAINRFRVYDRRREALAQAILGRARPFKLDDGGRIVLEGELMAYAAIADKVKFVGVGEMFQVWEPRAHQAFFDGLLALAAESAGALDSFDTPTAEEGRP